jgi:hypothetical protein
MNDLLSLIVNHGYIVICLIVFAEAIGVPVPGAVAIVAGGAAVASGALYGPAVALFAVMAMLLADSLLYVLGSRTGWTILKFLCRISVDPETCVLRAAESFYKRGWPAHVAGCQIHSRYQYDGRAPGWKYENAVLSVSGAGFPGRQRLRARVWCGRIYLP